MAREFASVNAGLWGDPDFRLLPPAAQHLYLLLWTSPDLSYAGVHDWRPGRLAARSSGFTGAHVDTVGQCLQARHFIVVDDDTEEALVRSWIRFDGLMKQPRMAISVVKGYSSTASDTLRAVLVHELRKVEQDRPDLLCWKDDRVRDVLSHPSVSAKDLPAPDDPFGDGFGDGFALGLAQTPSKVYPSVSGSPTPAPAPAPLLPAPPTPGRKRPARAIPDDWKPTQKHAALAAERGADLSTEAFRFRNHAIANDRRQANWDAAFNNWLGKAKPDPTQGGTIVDRRPEAWR